ncbi:multidrug efflux RND transporter permease subunit [Marinobacter adhaerens]|jgi:HAE1 family hydrophobic/amphiphilic exporter-1|uniref:Efflux pump membrane transporter n=2 Tax=Marinobacter adhaerens TaxID=1033846 RepID=A0ABX8ILE0_9GAMM|nr:multidrug efflux RND transporter permease subunit [Marinobacter adhaerens]ADP96697.1 transporter, hydrophobe/amphiphile efflux-1 (HAE1) family [Marinobacter adhaerens HP15]MBW4979315.1 multidrug efflux RND transporter permease subunit [Marinobacter adhaerens]QWV14667.1 multidrug efflux RND transporter permease subunit [Marinobacter adhaerens]
MISRVFIHRPKFAFVISILITLAGLLALRILPVNMYPDMAPPQIQVNASLPGASSQVVEEAVIRPVEQQLNGVEGMIYIESTASSDGTAKITLTFESGTDTDIAQVNVQNRVALAEPFLPDEVRRQGVVVSKQAGNMLMGINLTSERPDLDGVFLSNYASNNLVEALGRVPGVGSAEVMGAKDYSMRVWLDPRRMASLDVTVAEVAAALREQNQIVAAGKLGQPPVPAGQQFVYSIQTRERLSDPDEFAQTILRSRPDGGFVRLRDVGRIELGSRSYTSTAKLNNQDTAFLVIYQLPDANALEVAERVKALVEEASVSFPAGVNYTVLYDTTEFISRSISEVIVTLFQAVGLVILVVFLFLQNWRATLIPSIAIPVSLIGTFAVMSVLGYSINTITLFGLVLAIGIVVDDAIVVIENVERILAEEKLPIREAVTKAMAEVTGPVIATTLVLLAVFVPVAFMPGITGKLYQQFSVTISVAVIISSINALTLSPALCVALLGRSGDKAIGWLRPFEVAITRTTSGYSKLVVQLLRKGALVGVALAVILVAGAGLFKSVPSAFVPPEDQGFLFVDVQLPDAASLERTEAVLTKVTDMVLEDPAVTDFITVSGFSLLGGASSNNGLGIVMLKDWEEREDASLGLGAVIPRLYSRLWTIPEAQVMVFNPPPIPGLGTSSGFDFRLQDNQGRDVSELAQVMNGLIYEANQSEALSRVYSTYRANIPQYLLEVERNKAKALGIELSDIFSTLQTQLGSLYVNDFTRFGKNYRVLLQAEGEFRQRPEDLSHYFVRNRDGDMVPLTTLASLKPVLGPSSIQHFNLKRSVTISGEAAPGFASGDAIATMEELSQSLPQGYEFSWAGQSLQEIQAGNLAGVIFLLALVFVYLFLVAQYESWTLPVAVLGAVPLALAGAMAGLWLVGLANNIYAQVGLVLLIGLSTKTAILIVEFAMQLRQSGMSTAEAAQKAAVLRFRAVLMTALSFVLGVLPLVFASGAGAASRVSLGITVLSGMVAATVLGTLLVPVFYKWIQSVRDRRQPAA